jgi:HEAT repeat protein
MIKTYLIAIVFLHAMVVFAGEQDQDISVQLNAKDSESHILAMNAIRKTGKISPDQISRILEILLKKPSAPDTFIASETLRILAPEEAVLYLVKSLSDINAAVRSDAATALGNLRILEKIAVPALIKALSDGYPAVRSAAALALSSPSELSKDVVPELIKTLSDTNPGVRAATITSLQNLKYLAKDAIPEIIKMLSDQDSQVRMIAAYALGSLNELSKDILPALITAMSDENSIVRSAVVSALGNCKKSAQVILPILIKTLSDKESSVRSSAVYALKGLNELAKDAIPELIKTLSDKESWIRAAAAETLGGLKELAKDALPELIKVLSDSDPSVRSAAAEALGKLNEFAKSAVPALKIALDDSDPIVRTTAKNALIKLNELARDDEILSWVGKKGSVCEALDNILQNKSWQEISGHQSEFEVPLDSWDTAIYSLKELFLAKAVQPKKNDFIVMPNCQAPATNKLTDFSTSMIRLVERSTKENNNYWSGTDIYAKIFQISLLELNDDAQGSKKFSELLEANVTDLKESGIGGSAFNTYAYGAAMVSLHNKSSTKIWDQFENWAAKAADPLALPYKPNLPGAFETQRGSAARNSTVYLALYLNQNRSSFKIDRVTQLVDVIKNWHRYSGLLANQVPRDGVHNMKEDGVAPSYFFSSLPYIASAIKLLEKDPRLSDEQKADISKVKTNLREQLPKLIDSSGMQLLQGGKDTYKKTMYVSSPAYNYPLFGLALVSLIEESDSCYTPQFENNFGIVK